MTTAQQIAGTWPDGTQWVFTTSSTPPLSKPFGVFGLHINDRAVLLTKNHRGWDIPGGKMEVDETPEEALVREVQEETGMHVHTKRYIGQLTLNNPGLSIENQLILGYLVDNVLPRSEITGAECTDAQYISHSSETFNTSPKKELLEFIFAHCM